MSKTKADTRTRLLQAAEKTTYLYGFGSTSIADIAKAARVPLGNVYYHFKTKDEIGGTIVKLRISRFKKLLQDLDKADSPKERLCGFVDIKIKNRETLGEAIRGAWQRSRFPRLRRTSSIRNTRSIRTRPHLPRSNHDRKGGRATQEMDSDALTCKSLENYVLR